MAAWRGRKPCQGRPEGRRAGMHLDSIGPAFRGARREKPLASKSLKLQCLSKSGTWESLLRPRQNLPAIPGQEVKAFQQVTRTTPTSAGQAALTPAAHFQWLLCNSAATFLRSSTHSGVSYCPPAAEGSAESGRSEALLPFLRLKDCT